MRDRIYETSGWLHAKAWSATDQAAQGMSAIKKYPKRSACKVLNKSADKLILTPVKNITHALPVIAKAVIEPVPWAAKAIGREARAASAAGRSSYAQLK